MTAPALRHRFDDELDRLQRLENERWMARWRAEHHDEIERAVAAGNARGWVEHCISMRELHQAMLDSIYLLDPTDVPVIGQ